jgi:hypothetical protein
MSDMPRTAIWGRRYDATIDYESWNMGRDTLDAGIRSRYVDSNNGITMHVLEAGFEHRFQGGLNSYRILTDSRPADRRRVPASGAGAVSVPG